MTAQQAVDIARKEYPVSKVVSALDFGIFFAFVFAPIDALEENFVSGPYMQAVDKKTGRTYVYNILDDPSLYEKARPVQIEDLMDLKLSSFK